MKKALFIAAACCALGAGAQSVLTGTIQSANGTPVPFATVGIRNTQLGVMADELGTYNFTGLKNGIYLVTVNGLGYRDRVDTVNINGHTDFLHVMTVSSMDLDEVVVNATRVDKDNGMVFSNVDAATLRKQNLGQDAPFMLAQLPSVVVNSDAGNGVGYTGMRIRGTDGTRINVTINGVPVNDAESQGTFFVDMPDLVSSVNNIQVQRGVGGSSNGAGAFGASVNFQTNQLHDKPYAGLISTAGSYGTLRNTVSGGTGLMNNRFTVDARASLIKSDGYIDRASSALQSYYLAAGYYGKKSVLKFINFAGREKTYQAWNYVPEDSVKSGSRTYNEIGGYTDDQNKLQFYNNETDNYYQNNSQLHYIVKFNERFSLNLTGHYTKGRGYYEQFKEDETFADYNLPEAIAPAGDTITTTDLVRQLWLENDFAGGIFNLNYIAGKRLNMTVGGGYNTYFGQHYGKVIWARYSRVVNPYQYYSNNANKNDGNVYLKTSYRAVTNLNVFVDLQVRQVQYRFLGLDDSLVERLQDKAYTFFNPKAGISYDVNRFLNLYASVAVGNKEPNRDDFVQNTPDKRPKAEQLTDLEAGAKLESKKAYAAVNFYNMQYRDQLVLNGQVNAVGAPMRVNVASSYRRGIELEASFRLGAYFELGGNVTFSQNKVLAFDEYTDSSYVSGSDYVIYEKQIKHDETDIALSPDVVSAAHITIKPTKDMELIFINKYVGRQYLDNTSIKGRSINPYNVVDARFNYTIHTRLIPDISFMLAAYNIFSTLYETTGYTYSYYSDAALSTYNYLAPAAPLNFMGGISLRF